jgi:uncharacterized protein (DUF1015 family)
MNEAEPRSALLPLRGLRFRDSVPGGLPAVLGPSRDIESSDDARAFVRDRPYSAVRLEIEDDDAVVRFVGARELFRRWRREGVLARDDAPAYYVYEQEFQHDRARHVRRAVLGLVPLDAPDVCILPHEETWEENRERRLQLLRDLHASISPIFLIYACPAAAELLATITNGAPAAEGGNAAGERHRLWVVDEPAQVARVGALLRARRFVIADGHHRHEAARLYHRECPTPETGLVLACCVEASDPGIIIRPIHRVVSGMDRAAWQAAAERLSAWFEIATEPVGHRDGHDLARGLGDDVLPTAGIVLDRGSTLARLQLRSWDVAEPLLPPDLPASSRRLDVTVMTELVVRRALGIGHDEEPGRSQYVHDANAALDLARDDETSIALLIRPVRLPQVLDVAHAGARVPSKSTSFVPKVPVGLVIHEF